MPEIKEKASLSEVLADLDAKKIQGVQRYRAVNGYISLKARYSDTPVSGIFELTPFCNLDCKMCYVHLTANQIDPQERLLRVDEWKSIIKQAVEAGMLFADLTGGECLTYPGFKEIYLYLVSLGIQPGILTNGRLLTEEMISFFAEYPPAVLQVTLYGSNDEAYEKVCGHRVFHEVMDGIERVKQAGLNLYLSVTPNRYMQEDASALLDLVHSINVPYVIGGVTIPARPETGRDIKEFAIELDAYISITKKENIFLASLDNKTGQYVIPKYVPPQEQKLQGLSCGAAHSSFHVNWKGELCPCIAFSSTVHRKILDSSFAEAWNYIRKTMSCYAPPDECTKCRLRQNCVTCPGEKSMGTIGGGVNRFVCQKLQRYIDEGMITQSDTG